MKQTKRLLFILPWLCLVLGLMLLPPALADDLGHDHTYHTGYTIWSSPTSLPATPGKYYLTKDVELTATWQVPTGTTELCLNGKTITMNGDNADAVHVPAGATLYLYDGAENEGKITHGQSMWGSGVLVEGAFHMYGGSITGNTAYYDPMFYVGHQGGGVCVDRNGTFTMSGGAISDNEAACGGGVHLEDSAAFTMTGGAITGNTVVQSGGGVFMFGYIPTFTMSGGSITGNTARFGGGGVDVDAITLSGAPTITGNTSDEEANNLYLGNGKTVAIGEGGLTEGANIGVTTATAPTGEAPVNITTANSADYSRYFTSDNTDYIVQNSGEGSAQVVQLAVRPPHAHDMSVDCGDTDPVAFSHALTSSEGKLCIDGVVVEPVEKEGSVITTIPAGNYYLAENVVLDCYTQIIDADQAPVNLCLNGHTLDLRENRIDIRSTINNGKGVLNLCDCGEAGAITSTYVGGHTTAATVEVSNQFTMYGGKIANSNSENAGTTQALGVNGGQATLYGGEVVSRQDTAVFVDSNSGSALTLGGAVTLTGGGDAADIYLNNEYSTKIITLAGPLTTAQPYRVAADKAQPLTSGWNTHMADTPFSDHFVSVAKGLFIEKNNDGELVLSDYAITTQPTAGNRYTVTANGAPDYAPTGYAWYPAKVTTDEEVTDQNATPYPGDSYDGIGNYDESAPGEWCCTGYGMGIYRYFTIALSKGDTLKVKLTQADGYLSVSLCSNDDYVRAYDPNEEGEYVFAAPADGDYTLEVSLFHSAAAPTLTAKATKTVLGAAVAGQTTATLTADKAGDYLCRVTWADGTALNSNVVAYVPSASVHTHAWATAWSKDSTHHWHNCTASGCPVTENSGKDGYAAHTWGEGTVTKAPTATAEGVRTYTCAGCSATKTEAIPVLTFDISGTVTDSESAAVAGAAVKLMRGKDEIAGVTTDDSGHYSFPGVEAGSYNVVATKDGKTTIILVNVTDGHLAGQDLIMPSDDVNSVLEVKETAVTNTAADVSKTVVDGLAREAAAVKADNSGATSVTVTMTVEAKAEGAADHAGDIKAAATDKKLDYLEIKVVKTVDGDTEAITTTSDLLTIVIPFDFTGKDKTSVTVYRYHGGRVDTLTTTANGFGEKIVLGTDSITLYVKNFSTYAIGYSEAEEPAPAAVYYTLTAAAGEGGAIAPSGRVSVRSYSSRTFTVTPAAGYVIADVLVDGKSVGAVESYTFERVTRSHTIQAVFRSAEGYTVCPRDESCPVAAFVDAVAGEWYHDGIHYCLEHGLMMGIGNGKFAPGMTTSRAMIATVLWRLEGSPVPKARIADFPDVAEDSWYADAVRWCAEKEIVLGYDNGNFGPEDPITREQLAVMLWRYVRAERQGEAEGAADALAGYADADTVSEWAVDALCWAVEQGIVTDKDGVLDPAGTATRAESAAMLWRFLAGAEK